MIQKRIYIDIEAYNEWECDEIVAGKRRYGEKTGLPEDYFRNFDKWRFYLKKIYKNREIEFNGIIGMFIIDCENDGKSKNFKVVNKRFVQLTGTDASIDNFLKEIDGMTHVISYNGYSKPDHIGRVGFDFGIIKSNFGIVLDDIPEVESVDLMFTCHRNNIYGGLKGAEEKLGFTERKSGIYNFESLSKLINDMIFTEDKKLRDEMMGIHKIYNADDIRALLFIDQKLNNIRFI